MDYLLTEEQIMIRDLARQIAVEEDRAGAGRNWTSRTSSDGDHEGHGPGRPLWHLHPEEYGGLGKKSLDFYIAIEEISKACLGVSTTYAANALGSYPILLHGSDAQRRNTCLILQRERSLWPSA